MKPHRIVICIICICLAMALGACTTSKDKVKLKGESALKKYAEENCRPCTFVRMEEEQYKHIAYFTDNGCGFEFEVVSTVSEVGIDGSTAGYDEYTYDTWEGGYNKYIRSEIDAEAKAIAEEGGFQLDPYASTGNIAVIFGYVSTEQSIDEIASYLERISAVVKKADVYGLFGNCEIRAYRGDSQYENTFAVHRFKDGKTVSFEDYTGMRFADIAAEQLGVECTYVRTEEMPLGEIPGIQSLDNFDDSKKHRETAVYYFTTPDGKLRFIADYQKEYHVYYIADAQ